MVILVGDQVEFKSGVSFRANPSGKGMNPSLLSLSKCRAKDWVFYFLVLARQPVKKKENA